MKFALFLGLALLAQSIAATSVFEKTFNELHKPVEVEANDELKAKGILDVTTHWIEQKLDHFNATDERTWQMRYMENKQHFEVGGPIFIYVGGEWAINQLSIFSGHIVDMAKEHKGLLFYTEHRYYGKSEPTENLSTENMKYLDVKQALSDLAHFIRTIKRKYLFSGNVILAGGSYSATMVTWFHKMFPDVAVGSWASSAPLMARVDFWQYKVITGESIALMGGQECYDRIENGIAALEEMVDNNRGAELKALLKLCDNFDTNSTMDVWTLFSEMSDIFAGVVQTHTQGKIEKACQDIMSGEDDVAGLAKYVLRRISNSKASCTDMSYRALLEAHGDTTYTGGIMRQWVYQTCNEFGWYQTSYSRVQPFGTKFPVDFYQQLCRDVYGPQFTDRAILMNAGNTNSYFGALTVKVDNVYLTHGQLDPWRAMGIQDKKRATIIPVHAHCKDFGSISQNDHPELRASKQRIAELVRQWVAQEPKTAL